MYMVGGCVRDEILGLPSKDIDFSVVLDDGEKDFLSRRSGFHTPFQYMVDTLRGKGFKVFLETPEYLTVRAQFPEGTGEFEVMNLAGGPAKSGKKRLTADFVLARKESGYTDGRRPDKVEPGSLYDDLSRRDFTMNAIAKDGHSFIDPFRGMDDISKRLIRAVGDPHERLQEDALRAVRALRFSVTKRFQIEGELMKVLLFDTEVMTALADKIADERIADELSKMFRHDPMKSMEILNKYKGLTEAMFAGKVGIEATLKQRGRNK